MGREMDEWMQELEDGVVSDLVVSEDQIVNSN